jgi:organic hydroperoxide reductase OsmC/OhrA
MAGREHRYHVTVEWTGNTGTGTAGYRTYERRHEITASGSAKPGIPGSSDPAFRGDPARWNPEELLVASLSACHQLWYLHLCADAGVVVTAYVDRAEGTMIEDAAGAGQFSRVVLRPVVTVTAETDLARARALHHEAHAMCYIARSVSFPVEHEPEVHAE